MLVFFCEIDFLAKRLRDSPNDPMAASARPASKARWAITIRLSGSISIAAAQSGIGERYTEDVPQHILYLFQMPQGQMNLGDTLHVLKARGY